MSTNLNVAHTILEQLGGGRFIAMTGARGFVGSDNSLSFTIGRGAKKSINRVRVTLDPSDTYTVEFYRVRGIECTQIAEYTGAFCDMLADVFTEITGLATRL